MEQKTKKARDTIEEKEIVGAREPMEVRNPNEEWKKRKQEKQLKKKEK